MTIIKIEQNANGSHDNNTIYGVTPEDFSIPEGFALLPQEVGTPETLENYPFGDIAVDEIDGIPTITSWTPLPMPAPDPAPDPEPTAEDIIKTMLGG